MAINTLEILVLPVQLEAGFIVIEIPALPIAGVVTRVTSCSKSTLVHILFFVTGPAVRLGILEYDG